MARPRTPLAKAHVTGAYVRHKARYQGRHEPVVKDGIGEPPSWLTEHGQAAWRELAGSLPWLNSSHGSIVGITAHLAAGKMREGTLSVSGMNALRQCLGSLGASPADFSRVSWSPPVDEDDPGAEYFR